MGIVTNKKAFLSGLRDADAKARHRFEGYVWHAIELLHDKAMSLTPVWSGSAVGNYHWSVGAPSYTYSDPIDNGPPGPTNSMPLGPEPRRAPNEARSLATMFGLNVSNPFQIFWLNNADPDIVSLDYGLLPTPELSRSPHGMGRLSLYYVQQRLGQY